MFPCYCIFQEASIILKLILNFFPVSFQIKNRWQEVFAPETFSQKRCRQLGSKVTKRLTFYFYSLREKKSMKNIFFKNDILFFYFWKKYKIKRLKNDFEIFFKVTLPFISMHSSYIPLVLTVFSVFLENRILLSENKKVIR